jgi:hypothetical protein
MATYVAVISSHGKPTEVRLFDSETKARQFALDLSFAEGYENKAHYVEQHDDHAHEWHWLEDWGDEDGCGVVVGPANTNVGQ